MITNVTITMISGEVIKGKLVKEDSLYKYVETTLEYDEQAIAIFGKEYCDKHNTLINKLPINEIIDVQHEDDWYEYTEEYPYTDITDSDLL